MTDTGVLEDTILASSSVHWEGRYAAMALGDYHLFAATPLEESYADSDVYLHIHSLLDNEINEISKESVFLPAISKVRGGFCAARHAVTITPPLPPPYQGQDYP